MIKCVVCRKHIPVTKHQVYRVTEPQSITGAFSTPAKMYDAVDCPVCGCQHLLKVRLPEVKGGAEDDD
jgi:DNA-directed RNA polymerase subunit RPC12/RpoP